jgi:flagellar hook assembly protein FlgD
LFGSIGGKVAYVVGDVNPPAVYQFATDVAWNRILFGRKDEYVEAYLNAGSGGLSGPSGIDVSPQSTLFIADALNGRVVLAHFDAPSKTITTLGVASLFGIGGVPADVAWDGGTSPTQGGTEVFYVVDSSGRLSYWNYSPGVASVYWVYGSQGTGTGQFRGPTGVCAGHSLAANGGAVFTADVYVADAGNNRVVWLRRSSSGSTAVWVGSVTLDQAGVPADCAVDHYGNVYVADRRNSRVLKYTASLEALATYGSYGRGPNSYNTFSHPHALQIPFGIRSVGGTRVYYGEGRVITSEDWTDSSGSVEHWLGVDVSAMGTPWGGFGALGSYFTTDHAYVTVQVVLDATNSLMASPTVSEFRPPGMQSAYWDGNLGDGSAAPPEWYRFRISVVSGYGCDGSSWCQKTVTTDRFFARGRDCTVIFCPDPEPRRVGAGLLDAAEQVPAAFFLHQLVTAYAGPLTRRADLSAELHGARGDPSQPGMLSAQVRAQGLMALAVGVPASSTPTPLVVRVYSLSGVLVRELVREAVDPGEYVVGWDGTDRDGRPAPSGVYIAVMTSGGFRGIQRLIVARR